MGATHPRSNRQGYCMSTAESKEFNRQLKEFSAALGIDVGIATKKVAVDLFRAIVAKTPVDSGRARGSWNIAGGKADLSVQPPGANKRNSNGGDIAKTLSKVSPFDKIVISNNLPYIVALEQGSSTQAPRGMVAVSLEETRTFLARAVQNGI